MTSKTHVLPRILCASCRHCTKKETTKHDAEGLCLECHKRVKLMHARQCLYYKPRKHIKPKDKSEATAYDKS